MIDCPVCGGRRVSPWHEAGDWRVVKCAVCTYAWVVDATEKEGVVPFGWTRDILSESTKRKVMYRDRIRRLEAHRPNPRSWLDIGCGGGGLLRCLIDAGWQVEGVEPGPVADIVASELHIRVHKGDLAWAFDNVSLTKYGVVSYFHVLEHTLDPKHELLLAREVLAKDGVLAVEVPLFDALSWKVLRTRHRHFARAHRSYFTMRAISALLGRTGFKVVSCGHVPYFCTVGWLLMRIKVPQRICSKLPSFVLDQPVRVDLADVLLVLGKKGSVK